MVGPSCASLSSGQWPRSFVIRTSAAGFKPRLNSVTARRMASDTQALISRIEKAPDLAALEAERVAALGKQGAITQLLKTLGGMTPEQRQSEGPWIHALRESVSEAIAARKA